MKVFGFYYFSLFFYSIFESVGLISLCFYPYSSYSSYIGPIFFHNNRCNFSWALGI